ncbi:MAG: hypothetical protein R2748_22730 [Bryobacterales bacterium]
MTVFTLISMFVALGAALFLPLLMAGEQWKLQEQKARARRMADHKMNARLLRFDI